MLSREVYMKQSTDNLFRGVFMVAHSQYRFVLLALAHRLCEQKNSKLHLYAATHQAEKYYRQNAKLGVFATIKIKVRLCDAIRALNLKSVAGLRLVTVHPETNAADLRVALDADLNVLAATPGPSLIAAPNADPEGAEAKRRIDKFASKAHDVIYRDALGSALYPNALRHAAVIVGNLSSGIIEAGLFGLPVINAGSRQGGRLRQSYLVQGSFYTSASRQIPANL